ncbi:MAG TPA: formylglycine-generating enzyme family protein [Flavitalea sp.]|nr:formylglycine-generating enzyme family protein [Flavitalea sp.]
MDNIELKFEKINYNFPFVFVKGTGSDHYLFGDGPEAQEINIKDFFVSGFTVTQILYEHIMVSNPSNNKGSNIPVECISYDDIVHKNGFLEKLNSTTIYEQIKIRLGHNFSFQFRLPSETEWEYAAKGGIHGTDNFIYSGSNNLDEVGWYQRNSQDRSEPVGQKKPNQLGIYDMSGNVWEWCQDYFHTDSGKIPKDGSACLEKSDARVLRGGCFHNWAIHCTSTKRYEIMPEFGDPCISFRLVLAFDI